MENNFIACKYFYVKDKTENICVREFATNHEF